MTYSCSEDYEVHYHNDYENKIKVTPITIQDVQKNSKAFEKLTIPKSRLNANLSINRIINDTINNFSVETNYGVYIETENYHSYTFKILRPNGSNYLLENIVVSKISASEYETILYQYDITADELHMIEHGEFVDLEGKINKIFLENSLITTEVTGKYYYNGHCYEDNPIYVAGSLCKSGQHSFFQGTACDYWGGAGSATYGYYTWQTTEVACDDNGGGGSGGASSYSGGSGGTGGPRAITTPINNCITGNCFEDDEVSPQDLCNDLATKDANPDFINYMNDLKTRAASQNFESAYTMFQNASLGLQFSTRFDGTPAYPEVNIGVGFSSTSADLNSIGAIHCHLDNGTTYKIFSFSDIIALAEFASISTRPTAEFGIYVVTSSGTFCIKIKNKIQLKDRKNIMIATEGLYDEKLERFVKKSKPVDEQVLGFLRFLKEEKFNQSIELFEKDETTNQWNKLELTPNGKEINPTTC
jgi:hypothetical protein